MRHRHPFVIEDILELSSLPMTDNRIAPGHLDIAESCSDTVWKISVIKWFEGIRSSSSGSLSHLNHLFECFELCKCFENIFRNQIQRLVHTNDTVLKQENDLGYCGKFPWGPRLLELENKLHVIRWVFGGFRRWDHFWRLNDCHYLWSRRRRSWWLPSGGSVNVGVSICPVSCWFRGYLLSGVLVLKDIFGLIVGFLIILKKFQELLDELVLRFFGL